MERAEAEMRASSPDYEAELHGVLELDDEQLSAAVPEAVADFLATWPDEVGESSMLTGGYRADAEDVTDFVDAVQAQQGRVAELADQLNRNRADTDRSSAAATRSLLARERRRLQQLERDVKSSTLRGRIELLLTDAAALEDLRQHWIDTQLAARLNYPIFMAVSETGGKMSSGEHRYRVDSLGNRVEDSEGNALIEQDLVKYRDNDPDGIAEMFLKWGHENGLSFLQDI